MILDGVGGGCHLQCYWSTILALEGDGHLGCLLTTLPRIGHAIRRGRDDLDIFWAEGRILMCFDSRFEGESVLRPGGLSSTHVYVASQKRRK